MRYLVLSDIHANQIAFEAVLTHAGRQRWDKAVFLGDVVGYYTAPEEATRMLRELDPEVAILGNHDALLLASTQQSGLVSGEEGMVADIITRHTSELSKESLGFIHKLRSHVLTDGWEAAHGALRRPWEYMTNLPSAQANLPLLQRRLCLVGHTHVPAAYACVNTGTGDIWRSVSFRSERAVYRIPPKARVFFNPGSVGQPRDGIPQASYAVFDEDAQVIEHFRVPFDIVKVQRQVRTRGYPDVLATRLDLGR
ncbi:MAG TPA: metallophosphoesterase family protein [Trueperaceae bacterium]